jgi:biotin carboxyl carrier protein
MITELFSKPALDALSTPEQLDELVHRPPPRAWLALAVLAGLLGAAILWSVFGTLPVSISGQGIIIRPGGLLNIVAGSSGVIDSIPNFRVGEAVTKGQVLARIQQPALAQQIKLVQSELARLPAKSAQARQLEHQLRALELQYQLASNVVSVIDGHVVETMAMTGDTVSAGQPLVSLEVPDKVLSALIYLPPASNAKRLHAGMDAHISPVTSKKEHYGNLLGRIQSVAKYPATEPGMMAYLHNPALVQELSKNGPPLAVHVELLPDPRSANRYAWSSQAGRTVELTSGTLCSGDFIVENIHPISLVLPLFRDWFAR